MFVKICGITNREDALAATEAGASALGFIFYPGSPRCVTSGGIESWVGEIPAGVWRVGVFVDEAPAVIETVCATLGLDVVQLHGSETPERHPAGVRVWKAFRVNGTDRAHVPDYPAAEAILIDGAAWDWTRTSHLTRPLILAGGLSPENVRDRIARARVSAEIWGVDVASGIESAPGRKDHARMKKFIEAALRS